MPERVGVLAEYGRVGARLPLGLRSTTLLRCLFRHSSLVLCSCLILQVMVPKAHLTGKAKPESLQRRRVKSSGALLAKVLGGVAWMELHAVLPVGLESCAKPGFARLGLLCSQVDESFWMGELARGTEVCVIGSIRRIASGSAMVVVPRVRVKPTVVRL